MSDEETAVVRKLSMNTGLNKLSASVALKAISAASSKEGRLNTASFIRAIRQVARTSTGSLPKKADLKTLFRVFDTDNSGVLDAQEVAAGLTVFCGGPPEEKAVSAFDAYDKSQTGSLSRSELQQFLCSVYQTMYRLCPSLISINGATGLTPAKLAQDTAVGCFNTLDLNHDGAISMDEFVNFFHRSVSVTKIQALTYPDHTPADAQHLGDHPAGAAVSVTRHGSIHVAVAHDPLPAAASMEMHSAASSASPGLTQRMGGVSAPSRVSAEALKVWEAALAGSDDRELEDLGPPVEVKTQVVAGTKYIFLFGCGSEVQVWSQPWGNKVEILGKKIVAKALTYPDHTPADAQHLGDHPAGAAVSVTRHGSIHVAVAHDPLPAAASMKMHSAASSASPGLETCLADVQRAMAALQDLKAFVESDF